MDASSPHQREDALCQGPVPGVNTCSEVFKGKLQLATHLAVFAGFTGALVAGMWICQRNLIQNGEPELRRSADSIQQCQLK